MIDLVFPLARAARRAGSWARLHLTFVSRGRCEQLLRTGREEVHQKLTREYEARIRSLETTTTKRAEQLDQLLHSQREAIEGARSACSAAAETSRVSSIQASRMIDEARRTKERLDAHEQHLCRILEQLSALTARLFERELAAKVEKKKRAARRRRSQS